MTYRRKLRKLIDQKYVSFIASCCNFFMAISPKFWGVQTLKTMKPTKRGSRFVANMARFPVWERSAQNKTVKYMFEGQIWGPYRHPVRRGKGSDCKPAYFPRIPGGVQVAHYIGAWAE